MRKHIPYFLVLLLASIMFTIIGYSIDPERIFPESIVITLLIFTVLIIVYFTFRYLHSLINRDLN